MMQLADYASSNAGLSATELRMRVTEAREFHQRFLHETMCNGQGLHARHAPEWCEKFIRRNRTIAQAFVVKLGSNLVAKRRPDITQPFHDYIAQCLAAECAVTLRVVVGPVKNVQRYGEYQSADMAEYLMLIQLARAVQHIAAIYPYGVRAAMVPDDLRGGAANAWPAAYSKRYVGSLQRMVKQLEFDAWLNVEDGQARLYETHDVANYMHAATVEVMADAKFENKFARACDHARENLYSPHGTIGEDEVRQSAMRYLIMHSAEILSGMWSPVDALPLMYANHPGNYQLFTMGRGLTKLPWQIQLPFAQFCESPIGAMM